MGNDSRSLSHTKWNCKYHIVFAPKYRRQVIYKEIKADIPADTNCTIWALENDFLQLEFYDSAAGCMRRAWVIEPFVDNYTLWNDPAYNY